MEYSVRRTLEELIAIPSANPYFDESSAGEARVADYVQQRCLRAGLKVTRQTVFPGRDNLIVELRTGRPDATLLFEAHMDTVPVGSMENALQPIERDGKLFGRGACDTKGSLAGMLCALERAATQPDQLGGDIVLLCAVDEEHGAGGIKAFMQSGMPLAGAVIGEPTELQIVVAHKGCTRFSVATHGKAAHSSVPHEGNSAIYQMLEVLAFVRGEVEPKLATQWHPLCGAATIVVGTIRGGTQINIVPESCEIEIDRRVLPGEDAAGVLRTFEERLKNAVAGRGVNFSIRELLLDEPLDTDPVAAVVRCAREVARRLGIADEPAGVAYGSDASKVGAAGIPAIVFGPGSIAQAHSREEFVPLHEVETAAEFYYHLMRDFSAKANG